MTAKNSAYKLSRAVFQHIRELRTFTVLLAILYTMAGPVPLLVYLRNLKHDYPGNVPIENYAAGVGVYFRDTYFTVFYVMAVFLGFAAGLYITRYQNRRQESDFYHSLPVRRQDLLTARILAILVVQTVLIALIFAVPPIATIVTPFLHASEFSGLFGLTVVWSLTSFVNVLLLFMVALSMTLLAGQLTGNTFAQVLMLIAFNVTIPIAGLLTQFLLSNCYSTYVSGGITQKLVSCIIFTPLFDVFSNEYHTQMSQFGHRELIFSTFTYVVFILLAVISLALTYWLYSRRPAEKAGDTLIYRWVGTLIKMIYVVLAAFTFGGILGNVTIIGFIIGGLAAGILVHMIAEMIYNQDIFGVKKHWLSSLVATVIALGLSCCVYYNVIDYDHYLPKESSVKAVVVSDIPNDTPLSWRGINTMGYSTDREYISKVMAMAKEASNAKASVVATDESEVIVDDNGNEIYYNYGTPKQEVVSVNIGYQTISGLTTERSFTMSVDDAIAIFSELNDDANYHKSLWDKLLNTAESATDSGTMQIYPTGMQTMEDEPLNINVWNNDGSVNAEAATRKSALMKALKADIAVRNKEIVSSDRIATVDLNVDGYIVPVYEKDKETAALLSKWREEGYLQTKEDAVEKYVSQYEWAIIRYDNSDYGYSIDRMLSAEEAVKYLLNDVTDINQIIAGGIAYDEEYALAYFSRDYETDDIRGSYYNGFYLKKGHAAAAE